MATFIIDCPHCKVKRISSRVVALTSGRNNNFNIYLKCPTCHGPSVVEGYGSFVSSNAAKILSLETDLTEGFHVWNFIPRTAVDIPELIPDSIKRALVQAEHNFEISGHEESAAIMFRKALELTLKMKDDKINGMLGRRINELVNSGKIISSIGDWAKSVTLIANEAAHGDSDISREDLIDLKNITLAIIENLISLPERVERLRKTEA